MESPDLNSQQELNNLTVQEKLKQKFIDGTIKPNQFFDECLKIDQTADHIQEAQANIDMLEDKDVKNKIDSLDEDSKKKYYNILSISYFHNAQKNIDSIYFKKAYGYAQKNADDLDYQGWILYTKGTLAYFEQDTDVLQDSIDQLTGANKNILLKLLNSLQQGEDPRKAYLKSYLS